jgi:hypothetical protein
MSTGWQAIFEHYNIAAHDFAAQPFYLSAEQIKLATRSLIKTKDREARVLCKQDTRESRPTLFKKLGLFILPVANSNAYNFWAFDFADKADYNSIYLLNSAKFEVQA